MYETMAALFEKKDDNTYQLYSVCTVLYDKDEDTYLITSGEYEGSDEDDFDNITCEADHLFENGRIVGFSKCDLDNTKALFVFPIDYIKKYNVKNTNVVYTLIAKSLVGTKFNVINPFELEVKIEKKNEKDPRFTTNQIKKMLSSEYTIPKKEEEKIESSFEINDAIYTKVELPLTSKIDMNKVIQEISTKIVGQEETIDMVLSSIVYNQMIIDDLSRSYNFDVTLLDSAKVAILIDGETGTGKTAIIREIASKLDLPFVRININNFSETGYVGPSITDILRSAYLAAGRDINKAERCVVYLDEVDKIASKFNADGKDMKKGVQEELLGFISGGEYDVPLDPDGRGGRTIHMDTSKITFILGGAWTDLRERKIDEAKKKKRSIGFGRNEEIKEEDKTYVITPQDYIDEGLDKEFFGRIKVLTCTKTYEMEDLRGILLTSVISPLKNIERAVKLCGYSGITYTDEFLDEVCKQAYDMGTGARALQAIVLGIQIRLFRRLINKEFDLDKPIELTPDLLHQYNRSLIRRYK